MTLNQFKGKYILKNLLSIGIFYLILTACSKENEILPPTEDPSPPEPGVDIVQLPVVIHVIHNGEEIGEGPNLSTARILRQIDILNEDFRRKEGTRGYNEHPDGADSKIEFVLAKIDPESNLISGINRIDASKETVDNLGYNQNHFAQYAYWDPSQYINVWTTPLPQETECLALGVSTGPDTDLPGTQHLLLPGHNDADGILINWMHFGESNIDCHAKYGRTLTHEIGH